MEVKNLRVKFIETQKVQRVNKETEEPFEIKYFIFENLENKEKIKCLYGKDNTFPKNNLKPNNIYLIDINEGYKNLIYVNKIVETSNEIKSNEVKDFLSQKDFNIILQNQTRPSVEILSLFYKENQNSQSISLDEIVEQVKKVRNSLMEDFKK